MIARVAREPDKDELSDMVDAGATKANEILEGEVIWDGDHEEDGGPGARVWQRRMGYTPEQVGYTSSFAEF